MPESLSSRRIQFTTNLAELILWLNSQGIDVAIDYVKRCSTCPVGHPRSVHKVALAADLNFYIDGKWVSDDIYILNGEPMTAEEIHGLAHDYWENLGGSLRIARDLNHYSFEYNGVR